MYNHAWKKVSLGRRGNAIKLCAYEYLGLDVAVCDLDDDSNRYATVVGCMEYMLVYIQAALRLDA